MVGGDEPFDCGDTLCQIEAPDLLHLLARRGEGIYARSLQHYRDVAQFFTGDLMLVDYLPPTILGYGGAEELWD
jgi:hypothetical protein